MVPEGEAELHAGVAAYEQGDVAEALRLWLAGMEAGNPGCAHNVGVVLTEQSHDAPVWLHLAHAFVDELEGRRLLVDSTRPAFSPFDDMTDVAMYAVDESGQATGPLGHMPARERLLSAAEHFGWSIHPAGARALVGAWTTPHGHPALITFSLSQSPRGPWLCHVSCATAVGLPDQGAWRMRPEQRRFVDAVALLAGLPEEQGPEDPRAWCSLSGSSWIPMARDGSYAEVSADLPLLTLGYDFPMHATTSPLPYLDSAVSSLLAVQDIMCLAYASSPLLWSALMHGIPASLVADHSRALGL